MDTEIIYNCETLPGPMQPGGDITPLKFTNIFSVFFFFFTMKRFFFFFGLLDRTINSRSGEKKKNREVMLSYYSKTYRADTPMQ